MHPVSAALLLLGYAIALPIAFRIGRIISTQNRIGLLGHQFGVMVAAIGWAVRGSYPVAAAHIGWLVVARIAFALFGARSKPHTTN